MSTNSIVVEVREARENLAQRFNYDLHAIVCDARKRQAASGRQVVSFPPRKVGSHTTSVKLSEVL